MRPVTLQFNDERDLRRFVQVIHSTISEVNYNTLTLTCNCDDAEIELAKNAFNAELVTSDPR